MLGNVVIFYVEQVKLLSLALSHFLLNYLFSLYSQLESSCRSWLFRHLKYFIYISAWAAALILEPATKVRNFSRTARVEFIILLTMHMHEYLKILKLPECHSHAAGMLSLYRPWYFCCSKLALMWSPTGDFEKINTTFGPTNIEIMWFIMNNVGAVWIEIVKTDD